jgi:uncharacterized protein
MATALNSVPSIANNPIVAKTLREFWVGLRAIYQQNVPRIILYGSYARNEATEDSDLDLLLIFPQNNIRPGTEIDRLSLLLADLNLRYQVLVSIYPVAKQQYQKAVGPFWNNIQRDGIEIYEH